VGLSELIRPPGLQVEEERTASRLELFFDLAFVLVIAELAGALSKNLSTHGALVFVALYVVTWWSWASATLYANRFDTDDVVFRVLKLTGMLGVIGLAASAADATGRRAVQFAACYILLRGLLFLQYARAWRSVPDARPTIRLYLTGTAVSAGLWSVSLATPGSLRYILWTVGIVIEVLVPLTATFAPGSLPLHLEHLPERLGLFVILVLGESVASVAQGVHDTAWTAQSIGVGALSFVLAAGLWWSLPAVGGESPRTSSSTATCPLHSRSSPWQSASSTSSSRAAGCRRAHGRGSPCAAASPSTWARSASPTARWPPSGRPGGGGQPLLPR